MQTDREREAQAYTHPDSAVKRTMRSSEKGDAMQASDSKLGTELSRSHVYVVPHFQRPYVWSDDHWQLLWDDLAGAAESVEAEWADDNSDEAPDYFLGAIVTQVRKPKPRRLTASSVIDGQQRLTTLQILLAATREVASQLGLDSVAGKFDDLVTNSDRAVDIEFPEDRPKLVPLPIDKLAFEWAIRTGRSSLDRPVEGLHVSDQLCEAREWFESAVREWLSELEDPALRLEALHFAVDKRIQIVHIMLDSSEDPMVIFEVLNGRGEPLSAADLIKNLLFERAEAGGAHLDDLLTTWLPFDTSPWRDEMTTGRIRRVFIDVFIGYWLAAATGREIRVDDLFEEFKSWLSDSGLSAVDVVNRLRTDGDRYLELRSMNPTSPLGELVDAMEATRTSTPWPLVLGLATRDGVSDVELDEVAEAISSFTMRRAICRMTTKDYNNLFLSVLGGAQKVPPSRVGDAVRELLANQSADSRRWPSDSEFRSGLLDRNLFNNVYRARLRTLLVGIENHLHDARSEHDRARSASERLQIEHLLPQSWRDYWPVPVHDSHAAAVRQDAVHRLGNLTLLTQKLNGTIQHKAWSVKAPEVRRFTLLRLAHSSIFAKPSAAGQRWTDELWSRDWDEERIRIRSQWLAERAVEAWPRPAGGPDIDWEPQLRPPAAST
ncbi:MAG: DUF262 domain-containing protein [Ilumatobacteraceae bacterium]|nr:DUF262 domain-containing protein [Ilumatobacteraceae bacterium]